LFINQFSLRILIRLEGQQICKYPLRQLFHFSGHRLATEKLWRFCLTASGKTRKNGVAAAKPGDLLLFRNKREIDDNIL
jgi:hypothetical protein